jgi:hypothetical protein
MRVPYLLLLVLALVASQRVTGAQDDFDVATSIGKKSANLEETLEAGLQARRPEEFAFLRRVVTMVEQRQLPEELVRSTFAWARRKRPYPFPFFERGLKLRAARIGITVK